MGKKKLQRFAEMDILPNVYQPRYKEVYENGYYLKGKWSEKVFNNNNPIVLEIGCGKGEYTVELARLYPEKNFIGIDIKGARMWKGAKAAHTEGINNVAFIRMYAEMLDGVFAENEVSEFWLTFPDPQMAKVRKRLTGTRFLGIYQRVGINDAIINLKTDSSFLYTYTNALLKENSLNEIANFDDLYGGVYEDKILSIKTFYEKQWLSRGKTIKFLKFCLPQTIELQEPDIEIERDDYHSVTRLMVSD